MSFRRQPTGGPGNRDSIGAEMYATVFSLVESPHEPGVLWAGSDDGLMHITKDGGATWTPITPAGMPEWSMISCIELSPFDAGTAYVAATRYKLDDYRPYLYKTTDYGQSWSRIDSGIPEHDFTRVIRADPVRKGLLYAGTETGLYLSTDDGANWQRFQLNLPVAPVHEILIKENDLIVGTHGRSIWILDDLTLLHQTLDNAPGAQPQLFAPRPSIRYMPGVDWTDNTPGVNYMGGTGGLFLNGKDADGDAQRMILDAGTNPPKGAVIGYYLPEKPAEPILLTFSDAQGGLIRSFSSKPEPKPLADGEKPKIDKEPKIAAKAGYNRFVWDMRYAPATKIEGNDPPAEMVIEGPTVPPGRYTATLTVGAVVQTATFDVVQMPETPATPADLQAQFELSMAIFRKVDATIIAINRMRELRGQLDGWAKRAAGTPLAESATALKGRVLEIEKHLLVPDLRSGWADNFNNGVRLLDKLHGLISVVELGDYRPTDVSSDVLAYLSDAIDTQIARFETLLTEDLAVFNTQITAAGLGAVTPLAVPTA